MSRSRLMVCHLRTRGGFKGRPVNRVPMQVYGIAWQSEPMKLRTSEQSNQTNEKKKEKKNQKPYYNANEPDKTKQNKATKKKYIYIYIYSAPKSPGRQWAGGRDIRRTSSHRPLSFGPVLIQCGESTSSQDCFPGMSLKLCRAREWRGHAKTMWSPNCGVCGVQGQSGLYDYPSRIDAILLIVWEQWLSLGT